MGTPGQDVEIFRIFLEIIGSFLTDIRSNFSVSDIPPPSSYSTIITSVPRKKKVFFGLDRVDRRRKRVDNIIWDISLVKMQQPY